MPLYLVATPIGNLEDITVRAINLLREADLIACEDTRHTRKLLDHYNIKKPTLSYHEHNERSRSLQLIERLSGGGKIALVSDAGTPGVSDPAYRLVTAAIDRGIEVIPIPGPTALISGLIASGLPTDSFFFAGFLPVKKLARRKRLEELKSLKSTLVFYEAPHRIAETLKDAEEILGDRQAALARELTKLHEQFIRSNISQLRVHPDLKRPRGEMTLVIAGCHDDNLLLDVNISMTDQVERYINDEGLSRSDAIKEAARSRGISKRNAYQLLLEEKDEE